MHDIQLHDLHVLLIEPSDTQKIIILKHLEANLVTSVSTVSTIAEAQGYLAKELPDLVFSALHLSDGSSIDLVTYIKADER